MLKNVKNTEKELLLFYERTGVIEAYEAYLATKLKREKKGGK